MSLRLKTLGRLEIRWLDQPVITLTLRKSQALLVYLAMASDPQDRSRLAGLLWGELPEENARRNLRHALHTLRQVLVPDFIESNRLIAGLSSSYPCHVDALDFEASLTLAARRRKAGELDASVTHLEAAVSLYQGDFLDSFDVAESLEFEAWSASQRAQLRMHFLEALDFLVTYWTQRGVYERALRYARRQLLAEPLWEKSHRQMMTLLALTGQRSAALSQYQACRRILAGELGLEPLEETTALYRSIQSSNYPASSGNGMAFREAAVDALPFVGREAEHARLADRWDAARRGNGGLTLVEGEAGVGKTRLVDEVLRFVELQGATVVRGRCYEFGGGVPYQPIAEALRAHLHAAPPVVEPLWLAELSRLLPDVRQVYPDLPDTQHTMGETARQRLFEAVARFLRASLKPRSALCFFLDDLHWADVATLDLLHYLVRHLIEMPVWFVGAYRPEEAPLSHPLARLRQGLSRDRRATRLVLEPLSGASVDALAHTLVGRNDEDALGDFLYRESAGNAFMLMETVRALQERGALVAQEHDFHGVRQTLDEGGRPAWRWTGPPSAALLPVTVQDIILQRVGRLSEAAQRLLTLAAVLGQPFDLAFLQAAGRDAGHVSESLDEWLARRLVRAQPHASCVRYDFSHDKVRAVIYHTTLPALRQQLHFRVGEALEHLPLAGEAQEGQNVAGVLAYHWEQAGEPERALPYLMHAGDQARQVYAHREAAGYYRRALALLEDLGDARREERARTLMKLGLAHHYAFDYGEARRAYEAGFELWKQTSNTESQAPLPPAPHPLRVRWLAPTTLDPAMSPDNHTSTVLMQLFSGLVTLSVNMSIVPDIAWAWDIAEDGRRYTFYLRDDVRWSDGAPVTAYDFEFAWKRALDPASGSPSAGFLLDIRGAGAFRRGDAGPDTVGVAAVDETTLTVELEEPAGYFLQLLVRPDFFPVPRHIVASRGAAWTESEHFVTNGPFRLARPQRAGQLTLARNPDYHGRFGGNVEQVALFPITDWPARLHMYEEGRLDLLGITYCPSELLRTILARHARERVSTPVLESCYLIFDVARPPFDDVRVRQALALATDRQTLAMEILSGAVTPATGGLLPHGMPGHSPRVGLPYDPARARQLLSEAGFPEGRGFPAIAGLACDAVAPRVAYLHTQWQETLGIEIAWQTPGWSEFLKALRSRAYPLVYAMWVADYPDPDNFMRVSRAEVWPNWQHARYTALVTQAGQVMDQAERMRLYRQADELLIAEAPILPLTYEQEHLLVKPWVRHYPTTASRAVFWKDVILDPHV